ncbi:MAG: HIT family protein [Propionibacteriaceae bacterium]|jgi:histidine triad (HIT) family protein|nr:HIT family protein [Propionibacteriaceae bacterium]
MDCIFCAILAGEIPSKKVYEDETAFAFLDINPFHAGHTLVIPKRHVADLTADPQALAEIAPAVTNVAGLLLGKLDAEGLNLLVNSGSVAGQEVFHLHVHLIPRYADNPGMAGLARRDPDIDLDAVYRRIAG